MFASVGFIFIFLRGLFGYCCVTGIFLLSGLCVGGGRFDWFLGGWSFFCCVLGAI